MRADVCSVGNLLGFGLTKAALFNVVNLVSNALFLGRVYLRLLLANLGLEGNVTRNFSIRFHARRAKRDPTRDSLSRTSCSFFFFLK